MNTPASTVHIALANTQVAITFEGTVASERVLLGKTRDHAIKLVGLVHNLCGEAHRAAARAAMDLPTPDETTRAVMLEILREHLVVLCRSAPPLLALEPVALPVAFSRLGAAFAPGGAPLRESLLRALFGAPPGAAFSYDAILSGSRLGPLLTALKTREQALGLHACDIALPSDPSFFARISQDAAFRHLQAYGPHACGPLSERLLGRLYEVYKLCLAFGTPEEQAYAPQQTQPGVAQIAAARGMLVHRVTLAGDLVAAYAIETPTAAMLGEGGALACFLRAIARAPGADAALLHLALLSFDPCVPYALSMAEGSGGRPSCSPEQGDTLSPQRGLADA